MNPDTFWTICAAVGAAWIVVMGTLAVCGVIMHMFSRDEVPRVVCAWCGATLDKEPVHWEQQSHGMCERCLAAVRADAARMRAERLKEEASR